MEASISTNIQRNFLVEAKKRQIPVIIYIKNGYQMRGMIIDFDDCTVLVESDGKKQLLYKHAVSTVMPFVYGSDLRKGPSGYSAWQVYY